jgi:hypothetical protein
MNCPKCGGQAVAASSYSLREVTSLIIWHTTYWVQCGACQAKFQSDRPPQELAGKTPAEVEGHLSPAMPFGVLLISVITLLFGVLPYVGQALCLFSWYLNRRRRGWRIAIQVVLLLSFALLAWIEFQKFKESSHHSIRHR